MADKPFVRIEWHDAEDFSASGWAHEDQTKEFNSEPCLVISYGWLVARSKHYISIAADLIRPVTYGRIMKIPKKMIISMTELELEAKVKADSPTE